MSEDDYETLPTSSLSVNLLAGALAGITEHTVMYPFDSIKTRLQILSNQPSAIHSGVIHALRRISQREGWQSLWRGVNSVVIGAGPAHALYFATYEHCKSLFGGGGDNVIASGAAGACATIVSDGLMNPFDVIKQRMQLAASASATSLPPSNSSIHPSTPSTTAKPRPPTVLSTFLNIQSKEGLRAFYLSYPTTLTMTIPFQSIHFATYEVFRGRLNPSGAYDPLTHSVSGGIAGAVAAAATTPLDVIKTLLQTRGVSTDPDVRSVHGFWSAATLIWRREGIRGFFRGVTPRVLTHTPSTAVCWTVYEFLKHVLM